jgi:hypothetical protein
MDWRTAFREENGRNEVREISEHKYQRCSETTEHPVYGKIRCELPDGHVGPHAISKRIFLIDTEKPLEKFGPNYCLAKWGQRR